MQPDVLATGERGGHRREARKALLTALIRDRAWRGTPAESWVPRCAEKLGADELDERGVDWATERLRSLPFVPIPDGRYMVADQRYRCTTETNPDSRWCGWTRVNAIGARGGETLLKGQDRQAALFAIRRIGHQAAGAAYGKHTGRCPYCHLQLTDQRSLTAGCGKDCAAKHGIPW